MQNDFVIAEGLAGALSGFELLVGLLDHDDGGVDKASAGDGNARQRHDVDAHAHELQRDERQQDRDRDGHDWNDGAWEMPEENQNDENDRDDDFDDREPGAGNGTADEARAIIDGHDGDARRQARLNFLETRFHAVDDVESVAALAHDDDAGDGFASAVEVGRASADVGTEDDFAYVLDADGRSLGGGENCILKIFGGTNVAAAADHVLRAAEFEQAGAGFAVAAAHGFRHAGNRNAVGTQAVGIDVHLVLLRESAHCGDFGNAGNRLQVVLEVPVLIGTQLGETVLAGLIL